MATIAERSTAGGTDVRKWTVRIIIGVLLGEAVWNVIISFMNNVFVPWVGDMTGQSSGLPTSFSQRPYDYPDFLVSVVESCIAALIAAILNYRFERHRPGRLTSATSSIPTKPAEPPLRTTQTLTAEPATQATSPTLPAAPEATEPKQVAPDSTPPDTVAPPALVVGLEPAARSQEVAPQGSPVATSLTENLPPQVPKAKSPNPKKRKEIYYNSVGEPLPFDEDRT